VRKGTTPTDGVRRVAVKYCGGCDPTYDRVAYFERVKAAAGGRVSWSYAGETGQCDGLLVIAGCPTACPERDLDGCPGVPRVVVRDAARDPRQVVEMLLRER
jgi:hypothetical protein